MAQIKFVQTWDVVAGRKQEYAAFITGQFLPAMKASGLELDSGWYTLLGGGPHVVVESLAKSLGQVEKAIRREETREMLDRFMNLAENYARYVLEPTEWKTGSGAGGPSRVEAKFIQTWDVVPGKQEALDRFMREEHLFEMSRIGLTVTSAWRLMLGFGPQFVLEATAPNLAGIFDALSDERYLRLIIRIEELVKRHENRVLMRHGSLLDMLCGTYGRAIRAVAPDEMHSMVGPIGD